MNGERIIYIDFMQCIRAVFQKWTALLAMAGIGMLLAGGAAFLLADQEDVYQATTSVYCIGGEGSYSQTAQNIQVMNIYVDIIRSSRVAERANRILGNAYPDAESILSMITVDYGEQKSLISSVNTNSSIVIKLVGKSVNEQEAVDVANAMAEAFVMEMSSILGNSNVQLLDAASSAEKIYEAEKQNLIYIVLGAVAGMLLAAVWIVMKEIFSVNLNTVNDGTLYGKLDIIGVIPEFTQR